MSINVSFNDMKHARQTLEDFTLSYFPLYNLQLPHDFLQHWDVFAYVESVLYQLDKQNESRCRAPFPEEPSLDLESVRLFLKTNSLLSECMERMLAQGEEYWKLERKICGSFISESDFQLTLQEVHSCSAAKSFDYRVLHELLHLLYDAERSMPLQEYLQVDEQLLDIGDDLVDYEEDVIDNSFNIYRCYVRLFGKDAELNLVEYITKLEERRDSCLNQLQQELKEKIVSRQIEAATEPGSEKWVFPAPISDEKQFRERIQEQSESKDVLLHE